jgi:hypothetical protein
MGQPTVHPCVTVQYGVWTDVVYTYVYTVDILS